MLGRGGRFEKLGSQFHHNVRFKANLALERGKVLKLPAMRMLSTLITLIIFPPILPFKILKMIKVLKITKVGEVSILPTYHGRRSSAWRQAEYRSRKQRSET